ncbi:MAG: hypothetical protein KGL39_33185 [Patescibacteria group bacterium]|nr:hypothetical protein [Patescibacteria group bacterium]
MNSIIFPFDSTPNLLPNSALRWALAYYGTSQSVSASANSAVWANQDFKFGNNPYAATSSIAVANTGAKQPSNSAAVPSGYNSETVLAIYVLTAPASGVAKGPELYLFTHNFNSSFKALGVYSNLVTFKGELLGATLAAADVTQVGVQLFYATTLIKPATAIGSEVLFDVSTSAWTTITQTFDISSALSAGALTLGVRIRPTAVSSGNLSDQYSGFSLGLHQLNPGPRAGIWMPYGGSPVSDLNMVKTMYQKSYFTDGNPGTDAQNGMLELPSNTSASSQYISGHIVFTPEMVATPALTFYDYVGNSGRNSGYTSGGLVRSDDLNQIWGTLIGRAHAVVRIDCPGTYFSAVHWTADARP